MFEFILIRLPHQGERGEAGPPGPAGFAGPPVSKFYNSVHAIFLTLTQKLLKNYLAFSSQPPIHSRVLMDSLVLRERLEIMVLREILVLPDLLDPLVLQDLRFTQ